MKKIELTQRLLCLLLMLAVIVASGCEKTLDEPEPEPEPEFDPELLLSSLNMALVIGGEQEVVVAAIGKDGNPENFAVTSGNEAVATVTISDTVFRVTGVDYGTTKVTVTTASGKSREIPVRVYDPKILETEELLITFSQDFRFRWDDRMADYMIPLTKGSYWHTVRDWHAFLPDDAFRPLGSLAISGYDDPTGKQGVMMVKAKNGSDALAAPVD